MKNMLPLNEEVVRYTANVLGENSAAAKALTDAERRRAAGEVVTFWRMNRSILVVGEKSTAN